MDVVLKSENIAVERKNFIFDLREIRVAASSASPRMPTAVAIRS